MTNLSDFTHKHELELFLADNHPFSASYISINFLIKDDQMNETGKQFFTGNDHSQVMGILLF